LHALAWHYKKVGRKGIVENNDNKRQFSFLSGEKEMKRKRSQFREDKNHVKSDFQQHTKPTTLVEKQ
jgi:hypothetical protein